MSRPELERLVSTAEQDQALQASLRRCRSTAELLRSAHALGFGITRSDLLLARAEHQQEEQNQTVQPQPVPTQASERPSSRQGHRQGRRQAPSRTADQRQRRRHA